MCESSTSGVSIISAILCMRVRMYAEIMWDCSYTCVYVRCVYIHTNVHVQ